MLEKKKRLRYLKMRKRCETKSCKIITELPLLMLGYPLLRHCKYFLPFAIPA